MFEIRGETPAQPGVERIWLEHFLPIKQGDQVIGITTPSARKLPHPRKSRPNLSVNSAKPPPPRSSQAGQAKLAFGCWPITIQDVFWMNGLSHPSGSVRQPCLRNHLGPVAGSHLSRSMPPGWRQFIPKTGTLC